MSQRREYAYAVIGILALLVVIPIVSLETNLSDPVEWGVMIVGTVVAGAGLGGMQINHQPDSQRQPIFDSHLASTVLHALLWGLTVQTGFVVSGTQEPGAGDLTTVVPAWLVVAAWLTVVLGIFAVRGVPRALRPSHWLAAYRDGKRQARR